MYPPASLCFTAFSNVPFHSTFPFSICSIFHPLVTWFRRSRGRHCGRRHSLSGSLLVCFCSRGFFGGAPYLWAQPKDQGKSIQEQRSALSFCALCSLLGCLQMRPYLVLALPASQCLPCCCAGFAEHKIIMTCDLIDKCMQYHEQAVQPAMHAHNPALEHASMPTQSTEPTSIAPICTHGIVVSNNPNNSNTPMHVVSV